MAREKLKLAHPGVPAELDRYLVPTEKILFQRRLHWLVLWEPIMTVVAGTFVLGFVSSVLPTGVPFILDVLVVAWLVLVVRLLWFGAAVVPRLVRRHRPAADDDHGIITRKVAMMPLAKVTDMTYERSPIGKLFGYGTFVLESAGQDQPSARSSTCPSRTCSTG
jgi:uncharacterized membrane protein YdbT with pleckstrin-like domain